MLWQRAEDLTDNLQRLASLLLVLSSMKVTHRPEELRKACLVAEEQVRFAHRALGARVGKRRKQLDVIDAVQQLCQEVLRRLFGTTVILILGLLLQKCEESVECLAHETAFSTAADALEVKLLVGVLKERSLSRSNRRRRLKSTPGLDHFEEVEPARDVEGCPSF